MADGGGSYIGIIVSHSGCGGRRVSLCNLYSRVSKRWWLYAELSGVKAPQKQTTQPGNTFVCLPQDSLTFNINWQQTFVKVFIQKKSAEEHYILWQTCQCGDWDNVSAVTRSKMSHKWRDIKVNYLLICFNRFGWFNLQCTTLPPTHCCNKIQSDKGFGEVM